MRTSLYIAVVGILSALMLAATWVPALESPVFAQEIGVVSGTVEKGDAARGLTVRAGPSPDAEPLAFLPPGTPVRGFNDFRNGFVKIMAPMCVGWVLMENIKPVGGEGMVSKIDKPDLCLRVRKGPSGQFEKVSCAELGQKLQLTGMWSSNNWAQLEDGGWVSAAQIDTDLAPIAARFCPRVARGAPVVEDTVIDEYYPTAYFYRYRRHLYDYPYDPIFFGKIHHGKIFHGKIHHGKSQGVVHSKSWSGGGGTSVRTFSGQSGVGTKSFSTGAGTTGVRSFSGSTSGGSSSIKSFSTGGGTSVGSGGRRR